MKKRIIAGITLKNNLVVQSISYKKYLPLGKVEYFIKNLNRWGVDEILIRDIDSYSKKKKPNMEIIEKIKTISCNTPIIYGGGLSSLNYASKVLNFGIDRILMESLFLDNKLEFKKIVDNIGKQSVILSLSVCNGRVISYKNNINLDNISNDLEKHDLASEILLNDVRNDGSYGKFDKNNLNIFNKVKPKIICHGGLTNIDLMKDILRKKKVSAICISNYLNFKEHRYQNIKKNLRLGLVRQEKYE